MPWEVRLGNNEVIKQNEADVANWRNLSERCRKDKLEIKEFKFNGEAICPDADAYFVIYEALVLNVKGGGSDKDQHVKIGAGAIYYGRNKCRIKWFKVHGNPILYTEVTRGIFEGYKELSISRMKIENA